MGLLTAGYSTGQIVGPLVATHLLHYGYHNAQLLASVIVLGAAVAADLLRINAVHHEQIRIATHVQSVPRTSTTVVRTQGRERQRTDDQRALLEVFTREQRVPPTVADLTTNERPGHVEPACRRDTPPLA